MKLTLEKLTTSLKRAAQVRDGQDGPINRRKKASRNFMKRNLIELMEAYKSHKHSFSAL